MTPSEIRWREKYSDKEERKKQGGGGYVSEKRIAEQLGVVGWGRCVFMVRGESRDHFERACS